MKLTKEMRKTLFSFNDHERKIFLSLSDDEKVYILRLSEEDRRQTPRSHFKACGRGKFKPCFARKLCGVCRTHKCQNLPQMSKRPQMS